MLLVKPWRTLSRNFSHVLALEAKNIFEKSRRVPFNRRWIVFSDRRFAVAKDDDKESPKAQISDGEAAMIPTHSTSLSALATGEAEELDEALATDSISA
jgi:hypothetical protein